MLSKLHKDIWEWVFWKAVTSVSVDNTVCSDKTIFHFNKKWEKNVTNQSKVIFVFLNTNFYKVNF